MANSKSGTRRRVRKSNPAVEEILSVLRPMRGKNGLYGLVGTTKHGDITEIGVYNYNTKGYALYEVGEVDSDAIADIKRHIG
jgi:hypothetical protein